MRKRLLRSRSGFEKPESREEAIMQNILGASNVLEPSESNIEEILKSILYNTPYTKEAEFEIEKILLAIKNNGTYDGEVESRDMKILLAILRESNYTEETESRIEELYVEWLQQRSQIKVLEGVPPLTYTARGLPLINYLIEGNTVQNGTPTPDNPIMPQGTGERTNNLCDESAIQQGYYGALGSYSVFTADTKYRCFKLDLPVGTYTLNIMADEDMFILRCSNSTDGAITVYSAPPYSFTLSADATIYVSWRNTDTTNSFTNMKAMLNLGSTALPYEAHGYEIPILNNSTTTPVYLGEVETTRKIKKLVLTGKEDWSYVAGTTLNSAYYRFKIGALNSVIIENYEKCTHYSRKTIASATTEIGFCTQNSSGYNGAFVAFRPYEISAESELATWKAYLAAQYAAGTPVCVWYVLATEETAVVNEPLMRIGDYTDSISMEQTGIEIPTINGSNTFDVDTTVKPSNVYIEYK